MPGIREELFLQNPWWNSPTSIEQDEKIRAYQASAVKWDTEMRLPPGSVRVLRGPRQVGKTTAVMLAIRRLLRENVPPQSVCYVACDLIESAGKLYDYATEFDSFSRLYPASQRYLFIDEASFVKDWPLAVKRLKDAGRLNGYCVAVTGSNSADLKKGSERLPGRGIEGNESFLYPLSFSQYARAFKNAPALQVKTPFDLFENRLVKKSAWTALLKLQPSQRGLGELFAKFLSTGGFLKSINEFEGGKEPVRETYLRWIERDLSAFGRDIRTAQQILRAVIEKKASPSSLMSIAAQTDISSHNTVKEYLALLQDMQVLASYECFDISEKKTVHRKDKKLHFIDPFIAASCASWARTAMEEPQAVEGAVAEAIRRTAAQNGLQAGYYRDKNSEVDLVISKNGVLLPIEVKWQEKTSPSDFKPLYKFGFGILATKKTLQVHKEKYAAIPIPMLLSILKHDDFQRITYP